MLKKDIAIFSVQILAEETHSLDAFDTKEAKKALDEATVSILVYFLNHRCRWCCFES